MNKTITIKSDYQRDYAVQIIKDLPLDVVHDVDIKPHKDKRTALQNNLMHKWFGEEAKQTGETLGDVKKRYVREFLVDIFIRDDKDYAYTVECVRKVWRAGDKETSKHLFENMILKHTHTSDCDITQGCELLNLIEMSAASRGIELTRTDDYKLALGVETL